MITTRKNDCLYLLSKMLKIGRMVAMTANVRVLCVRAGFKKQIFNLKTKLDMKNESSINQCTPPDAKHLLADSASIKDLIHRDISRCNDDRCPTAPFCERYLQMGIDYKKGETLVSVTDFKGREKVGLCDYFLNVDVV